MTPPRISTADVRWSDMRDDERRGRRPSDLSAATILAALKAAGAITGGAPCA